MTIMSLRKGIYLSPTQLVDFVQLLCISIEEQDQLKENPCVLVFSMFTYSSYTVGSGRR